MTGEPPTVRQARILFLQMAGIRQHERTQVRRPFGAIDRSAETVGDEPWQQAGVIDVRVREKHGVERCGMHWKRAPVPPPQRLESLEQAAVDQHSFPIGLEKVFGTGHRSRGAEKRQRGHPFALY